MAQSVAQYTKDKACCGFASCLFTLCSASYVPHMGPSLMPSAVAPHLDRWVLTIGNGQVKKFSLE